MASRLVTLDRFCLSGVVWTMFAALFAAVFASGPASAQTIDFRLQATLNGQSALLGNGATIPFLTTVGATQTATVIATYIGGSQATISLQPQYTGSTEFTVMSTVTAPPPEVFNPNQFFTLTITFSPTNANQASGVITVNYTEPGTGTNGAPVQNSIVLNLVGQAPLFTLGYILETTKNFVSISSGGTIPFGPTQVNTTASAELEILNSGSGEGVITNITSTPATSPFQVSEIPPLPAGLPSQSNLPLLVTYSPTAVEKDTASIQITFQGGVTVTINFSGSGITSTFTYKVLITGKPTATVTPGGTITFPGANVGSTSDLILTITNSGSASGTINSISTSGPFTLGTPFTAAIPLTPGSSFSVPLTFTPTQVGTQTGYLVVGNAAPFLLSGQGLGANLTYAYTSNGTSIPVTSTGAVLFNPVAVGQSESLTFTITNSAPSGSLPATISLIATNPSNGIFTASPVALPQTLKAGQSLHLTITFTPTVTGISTSDLVVNLVSIPLEGNGTKPTALPSYTITGPSGDVGAATQANVSLTLSKAYSLALTGTLTITTDGDFGTDPAVQFATASTTGNRSVDFTIPAGSTSANFAGTGSSDPIQTGTVAETVTLTPTFATTGGQDLTPSSPTTLQFTVPSQAPVLVSAVVTNEAPSSFELVLTGYSTIRSLSSLNVTLTPAAGFNIQTTIPAIDLRQASAAWFTSAASEAFGGLFQIAETFTLQGTVKLGQELIESIASVTATVSNSIGTSSAQSAPVQ
jgi:hypothetical protein